MSFPENTEEFQRGHADYSAGAGREACPYRTIRKQFLWFCGWHTADMELSK